MNFAHQRGMSAGYQRGQLIFEARENETKQTESYPDECEAEPLSDSIPRLSNIVDNLKQDESSSQSLRAHIQDSNDQFDNGHQEGMMMLMIDQDQDNSCNEFGQITHDLTGLLPIMPVYQTQKQFYQIPPISTAKQSQWLGGENPVVWVQKQLHEQYFESFNFYFAKGINEILANLNISHVILFKDYLFLDDENEYLKRYYFKKEVPPRFNLLADFYTNQCKQTHPNLCTIGPAKIIAKRNYKLAKLFVRNQERLFKIMNGQDPNEEGNEYDDEGNVLRQSQGGGEEESAVGRGMRRLTNLLDDLDQPTKNSSVLDTQTFSSQNSQQQSQLDNEVSEGNDNNSEEISYESKSHDIYNPSFSSIGDSQDDTKHASATKKSLQKTIQQFMLPSDLTVSNVNIRPRGQFMVSRQKVVEKLFSHENYDQEQQYEQVRLVQYNELQDIEKDLPDHLQVYLTEGLGDKTAALKEIESSSKKQGGSKFTKSSQIQQQPIKRIKSLTIKSSEEELQQDMFIGQEGGAAASSSSSSLAPNTGRIPGIAKHRDDNNIIVTSSGLSLTQPGSSAAIRGALLAEYLSQNNPSSCRVTSKSLQNNQFSSTGGQQQQLQELAMQAQQLSHQPQNSSLLNRLPASIKKQLTLNLHENDKLVRNLIPNQYQSQPSPDRIWTDRDVNPRPTVHQENTVHFMDPYSTGSFPVFFQQQELSHSLAVSTHINQLDNANPKILKPVGALSEKKQLLAKITEETSQQHTHPAITNILLSALAKSNSHHLPLPNTDNKTANNSRNISSNPKSQLHNNPNSTNATQNNTNNQNPFSSANNSNIHNNSSSNGSNKGFSQIAMQSKIMSNTGRNSAAKISSHTSNVQDVYKKYQQMKINEEQGMQKSQQQIFTGRVSQEFQSFRPSGSSNSLHSFQHMPFFKISRNNAVVGEDNNTNTNNNGQDTNLQITIKNQKLLSDPPLAGTNKMVGLQQQQISIQPQTTTQKNKKSSQSQTSSQVGQLQELQSFDGSSRQYLSEGQFINPGNSAEQTGGAVRLGSKAKMNAVIAKAAAASSHVVSNPQTFRVSSPSNAAGNQKQIKTTKTRGNNKSATINAGGGSKTLRTSSLIKNLSGDDLGIINNNNNNNFNLGDSPTFKSQRQTPVAQQARKTPNYSSQNDKIFFTSANNQNTILQQKAANPASTKNASSKTIHVANSYVSPANARMMTPRSTGNGHYQNINTQPLARGAIDLNNFKSTLNSPGNNPQNVEKHNETDSSTNYQHKQQQHHHHFRSKNNHNASNSCSNLTNSINIHNINNNININNINAPEISATAAAQSQQNKIANCLQNSSPTLLLTKDTQLTQGNQFQKQTSSKNNNIPALLHTRQKSENLLKGTQNTAPAQEGASLVLPFDQKCLRSNLLNLHDSLQRQHPGIEQEQSSAAVEENPCSSQLRKQEFKLNISKIVNQQQEYTQNICKATGNCSSSNNNNTERNPSSTTSSRTANRTTSNNKVSTFQFLNEDNQENSYGFWTSRSSKQGQQLKQLQQQQSTNQGQISANSANSIKCSQLTVPKSSSNQQNTNHMANQGNNPAKKESKPASTTSNYQQLVESINYQRTNSIPQIHHTFGAFSERGPRHKSPVHSQQSNLLLKPSPQLGKQSNSSNLNCNDIPKVSPRQQQVMSNINASKKQPIFMEDLLGQKKQMSSLQSTISQTVEMNLNDQQNKPGKMISQQNQNQLQQYSMEKQQSSNNKLNK